MLRALLLSFTLATAGVFLACTERSVDPVASTGEITPAAKGNCPLTAEIADVFSHGGLRNAVIKQCHNIDGELDEGDTGGAVEKAFALIDKILGHHADGETTGDDEAVATLLNALLEMVGLEPIFPSSVDENTGGGTCDNAGCTIVNESGIAGFSVPPQTNLGMCYITFNLREFDPELFSGFDNYPFQFEFEIVCADEANGGELELAQDEVIFDPAATAGICFADPPLGPTTEEVPNENRQLAHLPDGEEVPDLLPVVPAEFLSDEDCEEASQVEEASLPFRALAKLEPISEFFVSPLWANPGRLGGAIAALSPIGPVDNRPQDAATTTTLVIDNPFLVDGETTTATATVSPDPPNELEGEVMFVLDEDEEGAVVKTLDDGEASVDIFCDFFGESSNEFADFEIGEGTHSLQAFFLGVDGFAESQSAVEEISCDSYIIG